MPPLKGRSKRLDGGDMLTVCQVLVQAACPISIRTGDYQRLEMLVGMLLEYSTRNSLVFWRIWGRCFKPVQTIKCGRAADRLTELRGGMEELRKIQYGVYYIVFLCEYAEAWSLAGQSQQALIAIEEALERCENNKEDRYVAELLRVKAELLLTAKRRRRGDGGHEAFPNLSRLVASTGRLVVGITNGDQSHAAGFREPTAQYEPNPLIPYTTNSPKATKPPISHSLAEF